MLHFFGSGSFVDDGETVLGRASVRSSQGVSTTHYIKGHKSIACGGNIHSRRNQPSSLFGHSTVCGEVIAGSIPAFRFGCGIELGSVVEILGVAASGEGTFSPIALIVVAYSFDTIFVFRVARQTTDGGGGDAAHVYDYIIFAFRCGRTEAHLPCCLSTACGPSDGGGGGHLRNGNVGHHITRIRCFECHLISVVAFVVLAADGFHAHHILGAVIQTGERINSVLHLHIDPFSGIGGFVLQEEIILIFAAFCPGHHSRGSGNAIHSEVGEVGTSGEVFADSAGEGDVRKHHTQRTCEQSTRGSVSRIVAVCRTGTSAVQSRTCASGVRIKCKGGNS